MLLGAFPGLATPQPYLASTTPLRAARCSALAVAGIAAGAAAIQTVAMPGEG